MDWKTKTRKLKDLRQFEGNPRTATDKQRKDLDKSLEKFNLADPLVVNTDGEIIGGNFRYRRLLEKHGEDYEIDVRVPEKKLNREQAKELNLRLNKNQGEWDEELLAEFGDEDLLEDVGFDGEELNEIFEPEEEIEVEKSNLKMPNELRNWKILNLYAGIGGNRKFWPNECEIVNIEYNKEIADALQKIFPNDEVIVDDAHDYLLNHFEEFDFIWTSPPCPTHSRMRKNLGVKCGGVKPVYPDMKLYEEILLLQGYFNGMWLVENVKSWYDPLIKPQELGRHYYWSNFDITQIKTETEIGSIDKWQDMDLEKHCKNFGYTEEEFNYIPNLFDYPKGKIIRNMVHPEVGEKILKAAFEQRNKVEKL